MRIVKQSVEIMDKLDGAAILKKLEKIGRVCYKSEGRIGEGTAEKFIKSIIDKGHESVLEHVSITVKFIVDRGVSHQLVRHRIASYCISGDTEVYTDLSNRGVRKRTIKELFEMDTQYRDMTHIRSIDESNLMLMNNKIMGVVENGIKEVFEIETEDGYKVKATGKHKFLTERGWLKLEDIEEGDLVYVNGTPMYQDREWLKKKYHVENMRYEDIGKLCNVSRHTIRKWIKKLGLQKELGTWNRGVEPPNKGRTKEDYEPMQRTSEKKKGKFYNKKLYGEDNPAYKGYSITTSGGYYRTQKAMEEVRLGVCTLCGMEAETEIHHLDKDPTNTDLSNLQELCTTCHKVVHSGAVVKKVRLAKVKSIRLKGEEMTYDIEMESPNHNYIANGFVVHNSQESTRYCNYSKDGFDGSVTFVQPLFAVEGTEGYDIWKKSCEASEKAYFDLLNFGWTPEQARNVLSHSIKTEVIATMNLRQWRHFIKLRTDRTAHPQIREVATMLQEQLRREVPIVFD